LGAVTKGSPVSFAISAAAASKEAIKPERLATLVANLKPNDLAPDESVAFDFAYALVRGGTLPEPLYRLAVQTLGQHGTNELIYLVGLYCLCRRRLMPSMCRFQSGSDAIRRVRDVGESRHFDACFRCGPQFREAFPNVRMLGWYRASDGCQPKSKALQMSPLNTPGSAECDRIIFAVRCGSVLCSRWKSRCASKHARVDYRTILARSSWF
jgi:hypothetical protein